MHHTVRHGCERQQRKAGPGRIETFAPAAIMQSIPQTRDLGGVFAQRAHSARTTRAQRQLLRSFAREQPRKPATSRSMHFKSSYTKAHPLCHPVLLHELVQSPWRQFRDALLLLDTGTPQLHPQSLNFLRLSPHGRCHALYVCWCPIVCVPHPDWCSHAVHITQKQKRS